MSNEAHNKDWVSRLDGLNHAAGEAGLDKNAAWDKLHTRMQRKQRKSKAGWYWAAAACVLAACLIPALLVHKQKYTGVHTSPAVTYHHSDTAAASVISKKEAPVNVVKEMHKPVAAQQEVAAILPALIHPVNPTNITAALKKDTLQITDTMLAAVPATAAPKKMRVVHINELGEATVNEVVYPEYKPFTIRVNSPAGLGDQTIANSTLNIHLSPKN
ncbi:hypothetical protein SAMN04488505_1011419 [Chitinophaga rupis]|uniref:Uncharacterized protein n=1 Tax=Chitinophaga rupis TaxID=573321 RepID=A0A1H7M6Y0_9BACT|nr:hypothetical protein [Chitinophaga rupis]SEL06862.1 hypothetical protein SAMN04488505_1011419 [Chitinophaga rupis]